MIGGGKKGGYFQILRLVLPKGYFSRGGEIGHDNKGLLRIPLSAFHAGSAVLEDSKFSDSTLACLGRGLLNISFMD